MYEWHSDSDIKALDRELLLTKATSLTPFVDMAMCNGTLLVAHSTGDVICYDMPSLNETNRFTVSHTIARIVCNQDASRVSILSTDHMLYTYTQLEGGSTTIASPTPADIKSPGSARLNHTRKKTAGCRLDHGYAQPNQDGVPGVWDVMWARDDKDILAVCVKNQLSIFTPSGQESVMFTCRLVEISSNGVTCLDVNAQRRSRESEADRARALVGEGIDTEGATTVSPGSFILSMPLRNERDFVHLIETQGLDAAEDYCMAQGYVRLWDILGNRSLLLDDIDRASRCYIKSHNFRGYSHIKHLSKIADASVRQSEIALYFRDYGTCRHTLTQSHRGDLMLGVNVLLDRWRDVVNEREIPVNEDTMRL
ncbi:hypothetical protein KIPB_007666, partial [Kipferlia bialata]|eukprot:g7666.t1